jgi:hypothetical protein
MVKDFKFLQGKSERAFTQWMDEMDDYHLGGIRHAVERPVPQLKLFNLGVVDNILGRIPSYNAIFQPDDYTISYTFVGIIGNLINDGLFGCFISMTIQRTDSSLVEINYDNVDEMNQRGLIFERDDIVTIRYKSN